MWIPKHDTRVLAIVSYYIQPLLNNEQHGRAHRQDRRRAHTGSQYDTLAEHSNAPVTTLDSSNPRCHPATSLDESTMLSGRRQVCLLISTHATPVASQAADNPTADKLKRTLKCQQPTQPEPTNDTTLTRTKRPLESLPIHPNPTLTPATYWNKN